MRIVSAVASTTVIDASPFCSTGVPRDPISVQQRGVGQVERLAVDVEQGAVDAPIGGGHQLGGVVVGDRHGASPWPTARASSLRCGYKGNRASDPSLNFHDF